MKYRKTILLEEKKEEIIKLYVVDKIGYYKIAKMFNCSFSTIKKILIENNVPITKIKNLPKEEIIKLFNSRYCLGEIGKMYNIKSADTIRKLVGNAGRKIDRIDKEECIRLYKEGNTLSRLCSIYNVSIGSIKKLLRENSIERRTKGPENITSTFNSKSCAYFYLFDEFNNTKGFYGENEFYIKELGYFPDYINFDLKLIIEWDENHHTYQKEIDEEREQKIKSIFQDFKFVRINESDVKELFSY